VFKTRTLAIFLLAAFVTAPLLVRAAASGGDYRIHGGDELTVNLAQDATYSPAPIVVLDDGSVIVPLAGRVRVGGDTPRAASAAIAHALRPYVRNPMISVFVSKPGAISVTVLGNVKTPGRYQIASQGRLLDAVAAAGGVGDVSASAYPDASVATPRGSVQKVSLSLLMRDGNLGADPVLDQNSIVYVSGGVSFSVQVLGAVDKAGQVDIHDGDRLSVAIAKAGSSRNANSDLNRIKLTRRMADGQSLTYLVDLYQALEQGDQRYDVVLKPGDTIFVPEANGRKNSANGLYSILYLLGRVFHL
jgi:polysaccharide export outer membrane protein